MRKSADRILTTHVGSLPIPRDFWSLNGADPSRLSAAVREVVLRQRDCGVDIVNEGEITKNGNWVVFVNERLTGFEAGTSGGSALLLTSSQDWKDFDEFYRAAMEGGTLFEQTRSTHNRPAAKPAWTGPARDLSPIAGRSP